MKTRYSSAPVKLIFWILIFGIFSSNSSAEEETISHKVNWNSPGHGTITEIRFRKQVHSDTQKAILSADAIQEAAGIYSYSIDFPSLEGFVPYLTVTTTNKNSGEEIYDAQIESSVVGSYTASTPLENYTIGIFDTGASASVISYQASVALGLNPYLTSNEIIVSGVTGSVSAWVTYPLGLFMGGLQTLDTSGGSPILVPSQMLGESNVSVIAGQEPLPSAPDLITAVGIPMGIFYITSIRNDFPVTVLYNGIHYTSPSLTFYDLETDPSILPDYPVKIPLELRPRDAIWVQYIPTIDIGSLEFIPSSPSVIIGGFSTQSLLFVHSVDLVNGSYSAIDKDRFMLDTGAQITTIGSRIAARLALDPDLWDFQVQITGVTGESIDAPGFYIDSLKIPALGAWLEFTHVPVVLLDIASSEGGTLDGIIGMNLFTQYNLLLRGGGFYLDDSPYLAVERIAPPLAGDIAPQPHDGRVDLIDFSAFSAAWHSETGQENWNPDADFTPDGQINVEDLIPLCEAWLNGVL